ncbi:MAG TPA: redoxin domain-containing protein [Verrucomicrobiae bacterium]|nr:redoxin domain-containing protein [Verrucomicrobiae bacterium]
MKTFQPVAPQFTLLQTLIALICFIGIGIATGAEQSRPTLTGTVQGEDGAPVPNATVFVHTAAPKVGAGILCPSCYADCRKQATTDRAGQFTIESLDPELTFQILAVARNHQPRFISKVDPAEKPLSISLKPKAGGESPNQRLLGKVVDPDGNPIAGAVVNIRGVTRGQSTRFGGNNEIDPVAVSDFAGEFVINGQTAFDAAGVDVVARGFAKRVFQKLATGDTRHELKLTEGVTLKGRVVKEGQPLPGVEIGVAGTERRAEIYIGDFSVATDQNGEFRFVNLPANTTYNLYGIMKSLSERGGSIVSQTLRTKDDGSTLDVGELVVKPGFTVAGQLRLTDGKPLPANTRVLLNRDGAWDTQQAVAETNGHFRFAGVPPESIGLSVRVKGYRMSARNGSLDPLNPYHLIGRVAANKLDLIVEFEPGEQHDRLDGDSRALREELLRGAEPTGRNEGDLEVTGTVVDAETKEPLNAFTVVPGRKGRIGDEIDWFSTRRTEHSNGTFKVYFTKQAQAPAVLIEAEGYLPQSSGPISATNETGITLSLKKGTGYGGVVLKPDGTPATNITVYLTDAKNGVYVDGEKLAVRDSIYRGTKKTTTDLNGRFSFKPLADAYSVIVVDEAGYAEVLVQDLGSDGEVRLQPYAHIEGQLLIGTRLGTNESIRLGLAYVPYLSHPRNFPALNFYINTRTDGEGKFVFERVPPIPIEVYHEPKIRDSSVGIIPQSQVTKFQPQPGETRKLVLGGKGRPVIGRLVVKGYDGTIDYRSDVFSLEAVLPQIAGLPDMVAASREFSVKLKSLDTDAEKVAAQETYQRQREEMLEQTRAFYRTEAGLQHHFKNRRFALNFSQDGSFRVEDVPAGKYNLRIDLREGGGDSFARMSSPQIAQLTKEVEVPDSPGGRSDEPFDLGEIELQARAIIKAGKAAPEFAVKTIDGEPLKLTDFKGKYLLLDFWAVWCGPCVAETPHLKATWDAFKDDPRFAMVGLSLDPDASAPRKYAAKSELGWIQGFLGDWSKSDVPAQFGVQGIPSIFLIGPDGKIIAKDLRGDAIKAAVKKALAKN